MAASTRFVCSACHASVEAWDEGDPFVVDPDGRKRYVYHPDPERERAVGVDVPHLCLACGRTAAAEAGEPAPPCPACGLPRLTPTMALGGAPCPTCRAGRFVAHAGAIS